MPLIISRFALGKGAAAIAVDIEESAHDAGEFRSPASSIRVIQHPIQRRNVPRSLEEETTGDY